MAQPKAPEDRKALFLLRAVCIAGCIASAAATLFHHGGLGAGFGIFGYGGLVAVAAREHPGEFRKQVSPFVFWIAFGVMTFLGAYVLANHT
jgi:hypothetical protein